MVDVNSFVAWGALLTAILGPLSGVVIAIIANRRSKKDINGSNQRIDKELNIKEKDVDTHYWSALVEGFSAQVGTLQETVENQQQQITGLQAKHTELEARVNTDQQLKQEMLAHILTLEQLVPNPPGVPKRPWV